MLATLPMRRTFAGYAFENLQLRAGQHLDLGEIRTRPPVYEDFPLDYQESPTKPAN